MLGTVLGLLLTAFAGAALAEDYIPNYTLDAAVAQGRLDLQQSARPRVGIFGSYFEDKNDVSLGQVGAAAAAFPVYGLPIGARLNYGTIHQDAKGGRPSSDYDRLAAVLDLGEVFVTPAFGLIGRVNYEGFDDQDESLLGGRLDARYHFENGSLAGLYGARESFWMDQDRRNPRVYNRLIDLSQLDSKDFRMDRGGAYANVRTLPGQSLYVEGGGDSYQDGNSRLWAYSHYQVEILDSRQGHWTAVKPNVYVEFVNRDDPAYFSPDNHVTVGLMLHAVRTYGPWTVEGEVNPQYLSTEGRSAAGIHGALDVGYTIGDLVLGAGLFGYADTGDYWLWRGLARLTYHF